MKYVASIFVCLITHGLWAQSTLTERLTSLKELVQTVRVKEEVYEQVLQFDPEAPYRMTLAVTKKDKKDRTIRYSYEVNLGMLSARKVSWKDSKDQIEVNLPSKDEPAVQYTEDDKLKGYEKKLPILAVDVNNAREIEAQVHEAIMLAEDAWEADLDLPQSYLGLEGWIQNRIETVDLGREAYEQIWDIDPERPIYVIFTQTILDGKENHKWVYQWDMDDLNPGSIRMNVKGKEAYIELKTNDRLPYIRVERDDDVYEYTDQVIIQCSKADLAQALVTGLRRMRDAASEEVEELPVPEDAAGAHAGLKAALQNFTVGKLTVKQTLMDVCRSTYTQSQDDGNFLDLQYQLDFSDLNAKSIEVEMRGTDLLIKAFTSSSRDYIALRENGEQQNYEDEITLYAADVPNAKEIKHYLAHLIDLCPTDVESGDWRTVKDAVQKGTEGILGLKQSLQQIDEDACRWAITIDKEGNRSSTTHRYELNLYDLAIDQTKIDVRGKEVFIDMATNDREQIIKDIETEGDDVKEGFVRGITVQVSDIPTAKTVQATIKKLVEGCEPMRR